MDPGAGPRVAGGVQRQADVGSGHRGPAGAHRGQLSLVFEDLPWGSLLFSGDPTRKGGVSGAPVCLQTTGTPR